MECRRSLPMAFFGEPNDCYTAKIVDAIWFNSGVVAGRSAASIRSNNSCLFTLLPGTLVGVPEVEAVTSTGDLKIAREVFESWRPSCGQRCASVTGLAVVVPLPLAHVMAKSCWTSLMLLGRWQCQVRAFDGWPPQRYFHWSQAGELAKVPRFDEVANPENHNWVRDGLRQIADNIRDLAPGVLQGQPRLRGRLEQMVGFLSVVSGELKPVGCVGSRCDAVALINMVLVAWRLRSRTKNRGYFEGMLSNSSAPYDL